MENYKVEVNGMVFDNRDPDCLLFVADACGELYAFVQCLDTGHDGTARWPKRYWGPFSWDDRAGSVRRIMETGGKWPTLPAWPEVQ